MRACDDRVVEDDKCGLLFPPGDSDALAAALIRLTDPDLRARFGENGEEAVRERYSWSHAASRLLRLYEELDPSRWRLLPTLSRHRLWRSKEIGRWIWPKTSQRRSTLDGRGRTLLMFAYYFPPCTCWPTASERSLGFATGLLELGWRPVIVTREVVDAGCACGPFPTPPEGRYRGFPEEDVRALSLWRRKPRASLHQRSRLRHQLRWLRQDLEILLDVKTDDWVARAIDAGEAILSEREVAAIWTTSGPLPVFASVSTSSDRFGLPWIADMRDGFMRQSFRPGRRVTLRRRFRVRRTLSTVRGLDRADARIYVADGEVSSDEGLFRSEAHVIPSGFDARSWGQLRSETRR